MNVSTQRKCPGPSIKEGNHINFLSSLNSCVHSLKKKYTYLCVCVCVQIVSKTVIISCQPLGTPIPFSSVFMGVYMSGILLLSGNISV